MQIVIRIDFHKKCIISLHCIVYCKFFNNYDSNNKYYKSEKPSKWYNPETVIIVDDCMRPCCYSSRKWCWNFYGVIEETLRISTWLSVLGCLTYLTSQVPEHKFCIWQFNTTNIESHSWKNSIRREAFQVRV